MRRVARGDRRDRSAASRNRERRAIEFAEGLRRSGMPGLHRLADESNWAWVKNITGEDQHQFSILGIDVAHPEPTQSLAAFKQKPVLGGVPPTNPEHWGKFCVLLEPAPSTAVVRGLFCGLTVVKLSVDENDAWLDQADVDDDSETGTLKVQPGGTAKVLWKESGAGDKWGVVILGAGQRQFEVARLTEDLEASSSASASIYRGEPGDEEDTGNTATVHAAKWQGTATLDDDTWIGMQSMFGKWLPVAAGCQT